MNHRHILMAYDHPQLELAEGAIENMNADHAEQAASAAVALLAVAAGEPLAAFRGRSLVASLQIRGRGAHGKIPAQDAKSETSHVAGTPRGKKDHCKISPIMAVDTPSDTTVD